MSHEIVRCMRCNKIIRQCRCINHNKATVYDICDNCRQDEAEKEKSNSAIDYEELYRKETGEDVDINTIVSYISWLIQKLTDRDALLTAEHNRRVAAEARLNYLEEVAYPSRAFDNIGVCQKYDRLKNEHEQSIKDFDKEAGK